MPNTPDKRKTEQPGTEEQRRRQQVNHDDDILEAPGEQDADGTTLRTEQGGETGEDEDLPDDDTQVNRNPDNFANDREKARDAGRKGRER